MPALPTTTAAFASSATEATFKSFLSDIRDFLASLLGTDGTTATARATLGANSFPAGTAMVFAQTSAPTGWTKSTTHNDKALRVVSGTASSGGSVAFSTVFSRTADDAATLSVAQLAAHSHTVPTYQTSSNIGQGANWIQHNGAITYNSSSGSQGSGSSHSHGMDIRVQYVDVIIATKD